MASGIPAAQTRKLIYGLRVERATSALPQSTSTTLFTVTGGRIILTGILGEVTTAVQAQATTIKLTSVSTVGSVTTDMCTTVDLTGAAVGTILGITAPGSAATIGSSVGQPNETIVQAGIIRATTVASSTGAMKWTVTYVPFDDGATLVAS